MWFEEWNCKWWWSKGDWEIEERKWELKRTQGGAKQEIRDEGKNLVNNVVKSWREEKEKAKISLKEIFRQMEYKENVGKKLVK